jgi:hypothetical protein
MLVLKAVPATTLKDMMQPELAGHDMGVAV